MLLAGRVRKADECDVIVQVLEKHLKRKVVPQQLFSLHEQTSPTTRRILQALVQNTCQGQSGAMLHVYVIDSHVQCTLCCYCDVACVCCRLRARGLDVWHAPHGGAGRSGATLRRTSAAGGRNRVTHFGLCHVLVHLVYNVYEKDCTCMNFACMCV